MSGLAAVAPRVAPRPEPRRVEVTLEGDFAGWHAIALADFPVSILQDLASQDVGRIVHALDYIVLEHNLPDRDGELAVMLADVDPYSGLVEIAGAIFEAVGNLPNLSGRR